MYSSRPSRPSRRMTSPFCTCRRSAMRAISASCSSVHAANHGTPCRRSITMVGAPAVLCHALLRCERRCQATRSHDRHGHGISKPRDLDHGGEFARPDYQHVDLAERGHRRVTRPEVRRDHLAEETSRTERVDMTAALRNRHRAGEDHEELPADPALARQNLTLVDLDPLGQLGHLFELRPRQSPKLVHRPEPVNSPLMLPLRLPRCSTPLASGSTRPGAASRYASVRPRPCNGVAR